MKKIFITLLLIVSLFADKTIVLKDGNTIHGKVLSLQNGVYTIKTSSLGTVNVNENQIEAIYNGNYRPQRQPRPRRTTTRFNSQNSAKLFNMANMSNMNPALIQQLMSNPHYMKVISDPKVIQAVQNGDLNAIFQSKEFQDLMNNMSQEDLDMIKNSLGQ